MSSPHTGTYHSTRASSYSRSLRPIRKSAPHCTTSSTTHSSPAASFPDSFPPPLGTCRPTSGISRPSSHRQTSLVCDKRANWTGRSRQPRHMTLNPPLQARVVRAASLSKSANSRRRCSPAARSPHCSVQRASLSWLRTPVLVLRAGNQRSFASCKLQRRMQSSRPPRLTRLQVDCRRSRRRAVRGVLLTKSRGKTYG